MAMDPNRGFNSINKQSTGWQRTSSTRYVGCAKWHPMDSSHRHTQERSASKYPPYQTCHLWFKKWVRQREHLSSLLSGYNSLCWYPRDKRTKAIFIEKVIGIYTIKPLARGSIWGDHPNFMIWAHLCYGLCKSKEYYTLWDIIGRPIGKMQYDEFTMFLSSTLRGIDR